MSCTTSSWEVTKHWQFLFSCKGLTDFTYTCACAHERTHTTENLTKAQYRVKIPKVVYGVFGFCFCFFVFWSYFFSFLFRKFFLFFLFLFPHTHTTGSLTKAQYRVKIPKVVYGVFCVCGFFFFFFFFFWSHFFFIFVLFREFFFLFLFLFTHTHPLHSEPLVNHSKPHFPSLH